MCKTGGVGGGSIVERIDKQGEEGEIEKQTPGVRGAGGAAAFGDKNIPETGI